MLSFWTKSSPRKSRAGADDVSFSPTIKVINSGDSIFICPRNLERGFCDADIGTCDDDVDSLWEQKERDKDGMAFFDFVQDSEYGNNEPLPMSPSGDDDDDDIYFPCLR